jgi:hypothetical protein
MAFSSNIATNVQVGLGMLYDSNDDRIMFAEISSMISTTSLPTMGLA